MSKKCFCGRATPFSSCCLPVIKKTRLALTPEELMRSRYSAYVTGAIDYIIETTAADQRVSLNREEISQWAKENVWIALEMLMADRDEVEFKAHYRDRRGKRVIHHERSLFVKDAGRWYYQDGEFY